MPLEDIFPVTIFKDYITNVDNKELIKACDEIKEIDKKGRAKCFRTFPLGYTSYFTIENIHELSEDNTEPYNKFSLLFEEIIKRSNYYADELLRTGGFDDQNGRQEKTRNTFINSCWINITEQYHFHDIHNHTGTFISGIYYLNDSSSITFCDITGLRSAKEPVFMSSSFPDNMEKVAVLHMRRRLLHLLHSFPTGSTISSHRTPWLRFIWL